MKKKKSVRVRAAVGYGPRHMMNAQEGSDAVPGDLPSPPAEDLTMKPNSLGNFRPALLAKALGQELGGLSKEDVAKMAVGMLVGGEAEPLGGGAAEPLLTRANRNGTTIRASFDATRPAPDPKVLEQQFADAGHNVSVTKFQPDLISATKGEHNYRIDVWDKNNRLSSDAAAKAMENMFGADAPYRGQTQLEQAAPLEDRYGAAHEYGAKKLTDAQLSSQEQDRRGKTKVGVAKGFGPAHSENSKEGEDLTKVNTDTVPAMLTPREAVLNRNASELAGRGNIEKLNSEGNKLARKGVDLAAGGMADVKEKIMKSKPKSSKPAASGSPYVQAFQNLMPKGGAPVGYQGGGGNVGGTDPMMPGMGGGLGARDQYGRQFSNRDASGSFASGNGVPPQPVIDPTPGPFPGRGPGGVYPGGVGAGQPMGGAGPFPGRLPNGLYGGTPLADGTSNVGPIGTPPQGEQAYGPPVNLTAPQIQQLAKQTGISPTQIMGLMKAFQGGKDIYNSVGTGGGYANQSPSAGEDFGNPNYIGLGTPSYQGGISDIGYPPFVAPSASYDGNRGGWLGPYDPSFMIQRYAGGTSYVSPFR